MRLLQLSLPIANSRVMGRQPILLTAAFVGMVGLLNLRFGWGSMRIDMFARGGLEGAIISHVWGGALVLGAATIWASGLFKHKDDQVLWEVAGQFILNGCATLFVIAVLSGPSPPTEALYVMAYLIGSIINTTSRGIMLIVRTFVISRVTDPQDPLALITLDDVHRIETED